MKIPSKSVGLIAEELAEWHKAFAYLPTRISDTHLIWLEPYERRGELVYQGDFIVRKEYRRADGFEEYYNETIRDIPGR